MNFFLFFFFALFSVGFFTLFERKVLGLLNFREGVGKSFFLGLFHFVVDFVGGLFKEWVELFLMNFYLYTVIPLFFLVFSFVMWFLFPFVGFFFFFGWSVILFLVYVGLKIFFFLFLSWSVNSVYSFYSLVRMMVQVISYEVSLFLSFLVYVVFFFFFELGGFYFVQLDVWLVFLSFFLFLIFFLSFVCEVYRLPFDFYEGESELVSGFNVEFGSIYFIYLYLVEYLDLLFVCFFLVLVGFCSFFFFFFFFFKVLWVVYLMVFFRGFFVRLRFDSMMFLMWLYFFPFLLGFLVFFLLG